MNLAHYLSKPVVNSPLYTAILNHDFETLEEHQRHLNTSVMDLYTPLQHAIIDGNFQAMHLLQKFFVDFNATNLYGMSALHIAAVFAAPWTLEYLVSYKGVKVSHTDFERRTPLHYAISFKRASNAVRLVTLGPSEVARPDVYGATPLLEACKTDQLEIVRALVEHGARCPGVRGGSVVGSGDTCLHHAAGNGNLKMVKLLLQTRPSLNARNRKRYTPLHTALSRGRPEIADSLTRAGADPKVEDADGETGLFYACRFDDYGLLTALLERGLDPLKRSRTGLGLLAVASQTGDKRCFARVTQAIARSLDPSPGFFRPWCC